MADTEVKNLPIETAPALTDYTINERIGGPGVQPKIVTWQKIKDLIAGGGGGSGTVTNVSVINANGLNGTVANPSTTPAITLLTTITGILKGVGGALAAAAAGDFPTLNQNTTGSAAKLTTSRTIGMSGDISYTSPSFDGTGNVTAAATISAQAVTYSKLQNISATKKILGRSSAGAGSAQEIGLGAGLDISGGNILSMLMNSLDMMFFTIAQSGTSAPTINIIFTTIATPTMARLNPGAYRMQFGTGILTANNCGIIGGYYDQSSPLDFSAQIINTTDIYLLSYISGTGTDSKYDGKQMYIIFIKK